MDAVAVVILEDDGARLLVGIDLAHDGVWLDRCDLLSRELVAIVPGGARCENVRLSDRARQLLDAA